MIFGIGLDLLNMTRVERLFDRYGDRFVEHVLTDEENLQFRAARRQIHYLATRFSGKEAIAKAKAKRKQKLLDAINEKKKCTIDTKLSGKEV